MGRAVFTLKSSEIIVACTCRSFRVFASHWKVLNCDNILRSPGLFSPFLCPPTRLQIWASSPRTLMMSKLESGEYERYLVFNRCLASERILIVCTQFSHHIFSSSNSNGKNMCSGLRRHLGSHPSTGPPFPPKVWEFIVECRIQNAQGD